MIRRLWHWLTGQRPPPRIPPVLWEATLARTTCLQYLSGNQKLRLKALTEEFLSRKQFSATNGLVLTDAMCVAISAQACLPILELGLQAYDGWVEIILYPAEFIVPRQWHDADGIVHEFDDVLAGEAWLGGPVILSWNDARHACANDNVVIHEFAHQLDMTNGEADGMPRLHSGLHPDAWQRCLQASYDDFCDRLDAGESLPIDPYAAEDPAEFFAVMSELFFGAPKTVMSYYPEFYALLACYYRQNPLADANAGR